MGVRAGYKLTEIGELPNDWMIARLGDLVLFDKGKAPQGIVNKDVHDAEPYLTVETLRNGHFTQWAKQQAGVVRARPDDIIMIWDGFYSGTVFTGLGGILGSTAVKVVPKNPELVTGFLFNFLKTRFSELNS